MFTCVLKVCVWGQEYIQAYSCVFGRVFMYMCRYKCCLYYQHRIHQHNINRSTNAYTYRIVCNTSTHWTRLPTHQTTIVYAVTYVNLLFVAVSWWIYYPTNTSQLVFTCSTITPQFNTYTSMWQRLLELHVKTRQSSSRVCSIIGLVVEVPNGPVEYLMVSY